jgi:hypothetical protein
LADDICLKRKVIDEEYYLERDKNNVWSSVNFYINGEEYGTREKEESMTDSQRFKPYKLISNGETVTVNIYDDYWEW